MAIEKIMMYKCRCERCGHEWITRDDKIPTVCPKCKNPYWNKPLQERGITAKEEMKYEEFKEKIREILKKYPKGLGWSEIREIGKFPQKVPNNKWVKKLEKEISLRREKVKGKLIWKIENEGAN